MIIYVQGDYNNYECGLEISGAEAGDDGEWSCDIESYVRRYRRQRGDGKTVSKTFSVSVEIPTTITNTKTTTTKIPTTTTSTTTHYEDYEDYGDYEDYENTMKTARARAEPVMPEFTEEVANLTVVPGRKAVLSCHVTQLGPYKVVRGFYTGFPSSLTFLNHQGYVGQRQTDNDGNS